ncbi:Protein CBG07872 [Caenorhabditis briggsae]|uniref:Protein CBG07872 n=1 Tax=Caenorhabditis briggsae TaxID=6238 RepID=A8X5B5_CAEBR|nr:Protein CBG07872 [Caenorhabditis briggsae]CAP27814.1 Protein CBG07872 [Caenorhabditis briggsae]
MFSDSNENKARNLEVFADKAALLLKWWKPEDVEEEMPRTGHYFLHIYKKVAKADDWKTSAQMEFRSPASSSLYCLTNGDVGQRDSQKKRLTVCLRSDKIQKCSVEENGSWKTLPWQKPEGCVDIPHKYWRV